MNARSEGGVPGASGLGDSPRRGSADSRLIARGRSTTAASYDLRSSVTLRGVFFSARCPNDARLLVCTSNPPLDGGFALSRAIGSDTLVFRLLGQVRRGHRSPDGIGVPQRGQTRLVSDGMRTLAAGLEDDWVASYACGPTAGDMLSGSS